MVATPSREKTTMLAQCHTFCGILPKKCHVAPSPLATQMAPFATRDIAHSTRTEIIAHSTRMSHIRNYARPTFYLIRMSHSRNSVRPMSHFIRISHNRNSVQPTSHLLRILRIRHLSPDGRGQRFNFPGQTCSGLPVTLTRKISAVDNSASPDRHVRILW